jgi:hypothetical protein
MNTKRDASWRHLITCVELIKNTGLNKAASIGWLLPLLLSLRLLILRLATHPAKSQS